MPPTTSAAAAAVASVTAIIVSIILSIAVSFPTPPTISIVVVVVSSTAPVIVSAIPIATTSAVIIITAGTASTTTRALPQINLTNAHCFGIAIFRKGNNKLGSSQRLSGHIIMRQNTIHNGIVPGYRVLFISIQSSHGTSYSAEMFHLGSVSKVGLGPSFNPFGFYQLRFDIPLNLDRQTG